jgi:addiction module RelB/DinJ family antitoxin
MNTTILVKTNKELKNKAQDLAADLGLSITDVVNASLRQFIVNQGITISRIPTESLDMYTNKKDILSAYNASLKEF